MNDPSKTAGTHTVFNQPPPLDPYNLFSTDTQLKEEIKPLVWAESKLNDYRYLAGHEFFSAGSLANQTCLSCEPLIDLDTESIRWISTLPTIS